jgi:hypothetical protein
MRTSGTAARTANLLSCLSRKLDSGLMPLILADRMTSRPPIAS